MSHTSTSASRRLPTSSLPRAAASSRHPAVSAWRFLLDRVPIWMLGLGIALTVLLGLVGFSLSSYRQNHAPLALFAYALTPIQLRECSQRLSAWNVEHTSNTDGNNLLLAPEQRLAVLHRLSQEGYPHRDNSGDKSGMLVSTSMDKLRQEKATLEDGLASSLRSMQGIQSATVRIATPESEFTDLRPTASVILELQPGYRMNRAQAQSVSRFVAAAVPGLSPEAVETVDSAGRTLTVHQDQPEDDFQMEVQRQVEAHLQDKAQLALDKAFGPGAASVNLAVELDFSQFEIKQNIVGKPGEGGSVTVDQTKMEFYGNGKEPSAQAEDQELAPPPTEKRKYSQVVAGHRIDPTKVNTWRIEKLPRKTRLSCSVSLTLAGQKEKAEKIVRGAICLTEERGDEIFVVDVPATNNVTADAGIIRNHSSAPPIPPAPSNPLPLLGLGVLVASLAGAAGVVVLGTRRAFRTRPELKTAPLSGTMSLQDLTPPSSGADVTAVSSLDQLSRLAQRHPQETARWLRETYNS